MFDFKSIALKAIHDIGGCDAADEYARGYDDGVNAAFAAVQSLASEDQRIEALARHYGFTSQANMLTEEEKKLTEEFWERKANEPPTDKCVDEAGWEEFGKKVRGEK